MKYISIDSMFLPLSYFSAITTTIISSIIRIFIMDIPIIRVSYGGRHGGAFPHPTIFLTLPPPPPTMVHLPLKNEAPPPPPNWKVEPPSRKWFLGKNPEKSGTVINTCLSKTTLEKYGRNSTRTWFSYL